ncbi:arsenate reductase ArsC [Massilia sp. R2A-15]|uniref:arsenate reductase ArsC n=1 Tax=Massilia sp. R2A-15 TaxID=3064278 RepID=UPI00273415DB|nr:arsenate reductase ArsC [Massilia sp. R2A-15]WLI91342.1 arsenate reductase ArsC [Massilia sp. R2A-15]
MNQQCINVLFLSSGNSTRSIMAEAILRRLGGERFRAFSAGSHPTGRVNPLALEQLRLRGYPTDGLASKSWSRFSKEDAPPLSLLIGVCGKVVDERHPAWPGSPPQLYWNLPSPGTVQGSDAEVRAVFSSVCARLEQAMRELIELPLEQLEPEEALARLHDIGPR